MTMNEAAFTNAVDWLANAHRLVVFTGAGVSHHIEWFLGPSLAFAALLLA